ncbi:MULTISPECIES: hypothetical protein [unclassified Streptomyces]|uniref:hypothetical protein n=1 Tax=unclassified Streptomyces TaxID=2593676 RepID=UPI00224DB3D5|nr:MULTISPECIES: hypothetical protein [unclassified Streptomyces]MCX5009900.1 hypothetical protein [Streptomyces sp. NBC_00555]MCX5610329.1 hypothetical protein [Streptomyces sp. NBC_00047]
MRTRTTTATTGLVAALAALLVLAGCTAPGGRPGGAVTSGASAPAPSGGSGYEGPRPQDQNLLAWTGDPNDAGHVTAQTAAGVGGRVTLVRIVLREEITWSNIWLGLAGIDPNAQLANCQLGVYDARGTLLAATADISPQLMTEAIAKPLPLAKPFTAAPGTYFIALLLNGNWATNALTLKSTGAGISVNAGLAPPLLRYSTILTGQTSLPATVNLAEQSTSTINTGWASQWYAIS